jgi:hypothetical protein
MSSSDEKGSKGGFFRGAYLGIRRWIFQWTRASPNGTVRADIVTTTICKKIISYSDDEFFQYPIIACMLGKVSNLKVLTRCPDSLKYFGTKLNVHCSASDERSDPYNRSRRI